MTALTGPVGLSDLNVSFGPALAPAGAPRTSFARSAHPRSIRNTSSYRLSCVRSLAIDYLFRITAWAGSHRHRSGPPPRRKSAIQLNVLSQFMGGVASVPKHTRP